MRWGGGLENHIKFTEECVSCIEKYVLRKRKKCLQIAQHGFANTSLNQKDSPWSGNPLNLSKENISYAAVSKDHVVSLLGYEKSHHY